MLKTLLISTAIILGSCGLGFASDTYPVPNVMPAPTIKVPVEIPQGKCSTDPTLIKTLTDNGYDSMRQFQDWSRPEVYHALFYSMTDNRMVLAHTIAASDDPSEILKTCIEYIGVKPDAEGPILKKFVLHQHIDHMD